MVALKQFVEWSLENSGRMRMARVVNGRGLLDTLVRASRAMAFQFHAGFWEQEIDMFAGRLYETVFTVEGGLTESDLQAAAKNGIEIIELGQTGGTEIEVSKGNVRNAADFVGSYERGLEV